MRFVDTVQIIQRRLSFGVHLLQSNPPPHARSVALLPRAAAVAVCLFCRASGETGLVLQRRQRHGPHGFQVSFPGGMVQGRGLEEYDTTLLETALRETQEELGAGPTTDHAVDVIGRLPLCRTQTTRIWVTPFVVSLRRAPFCVDPTEVAEVIEVDLEELGRTRVVHGVAWDEKMRHWRPGTTYRSNDGHVVWGLTARVLDALFGILEGGGGGATA